MCDILYKLAACEKNDNQYIIYLPKLPLFYVATKTQEEDFLYCMSTLFLYGVYKQTNIFKHLFQGLHSKFQNLPKAVANVGETLQSWIRIHLFYFLVFSFTFLTYQFLFLRVFLFLSSNKPQKSWLHCRSDRIESEWRKKWEIHKVSSYLSCPGILQRKGAFWQALWDRFNRYT